MAKEAAAKETKKSTSTGNTALDAVMSQIRKEFGEMSIMRLGDREIEDIPVISTGALSLDMALGVNGLPRGRVVECYGQESSGKTTLALHVVANAQKAGGVAAFIDAEHALDPGYAKKIGVDLDNLIVSQPNSGEEALTICEQLCKSGALDVIVVDSVAALTPQAEIDGNMGDSHMGLQARLMSQAMRKLTGVLASTKTLCIFTNQVREKIGVMFGNPETTPGGKAQVLRELPSPGPAHRRDQGSCGIRHRQPHAREGREEQGGAAVHGGRVRHPLHLRHLVGGLHPRRGARPRRGREARQLDRLRERPARPGFDGHHPVPQGPSGNRERDRREGQGRAGDSGTQEEVSKTKVQTQ